MFLIVFFSLVIAFSLSYTVNLKVNDIQRQNDKSKRRSAPTPPSNDKGDIK